MGFYIDFNTLMKGQLEVLPDNQLSSCFDFKMGSQRIIVVVVDYLRTMHNTDIQKALIIEYTLYIFQTLW